MGPTLVQTLVKTRATSARTACALRAQRGLSMIELMISMTIGLIIISAIGYLYINTRGAFSTNSAIARIQEDGRFGLDAILRDARNLGSVGCTAQPAFRSNAAALSLPGDSGGPKLYTGPGTDLFGVQPSGYQFSPSPSTTFPWATVPPANAPPWIAGDVLQMVVPTSAPVALTADADNVNFTISIANDLAGLQSGDFVVVSNCTYATMTNVTSAPPLPGPAPALLGLSPAPLLPDTVNPQMSLGAHPVAQRIDAVTYYVGQFPGRPWPALYRYSARFGVAEEIIDHVENMNVMYGVGNQPPASAAAITAAGAWANVTSLRVALQVVGGDNAPGASTAGASSTANALQPVTLVPPTAYPAPDTRLRQVFTGTAALRNRNR